MIQRKMCVYAVGTAIGLAAAHTASGQWAGQSLGTVEFRWRERSTAGYNGSYTLGPGAVAGIDAVPTPNPSATSVTAQDASVVLVLEARVTQAAGIVGNPIRGLQYGEFDVKTNQTAGGAFARQNINDVYPGVNPRANARVDTVNLGVDTSTLVNFPASGVPRGVVSPFRSYADYLGPSTNSPDVGRTSANANVIRGVGLGLHRELLTPGNVDATNPGEYELAGLNAWVPVYITIYTITDVTTARDIVFTLDRPENEFGQGAPDYGLRAWRGAPNPSNGNFDSWQLLPGFTTPPTFTVHVVPGPGAAGALGLGGVLVMARRRR